jgi:RNA polymerase sigma-70 factor (ECF subfamily)
VLNDDFRSRLLAAIPAARLYARALKRTESTRDPIAQWNRENEADDIVQESLLKAIDRREQFEVGANMEAWLIGIIRNTSIDRHRNHDVSRTESFENRVENSGFDIKGPEEPMDTIELSEVEEFINDLPEQERVIIRMAIEGRKYQEIADALGLTRTNVGALLCRARKKIYAAFPER